MHGESPGPPPRRNSLDHLMHSGPPGKWWTNPGVVERLGLTTDQQKRIEALFQTSRLHLIDLTAALDKENALLDPLLEAEHADQGRILAQIDRIAQARAELEKANARFVLGIRDVLTWDQWRKLQFERPERPPDHRP